MNSVLQPRPLVVLGLNVWMGTAGVWGLGSVWACDATFPSRFSSATSLLHDHVSSRGSRSAFAMRPLDVIV